MPATLSENYSNTLNPQELEEAFRALARIDYSFYLEYVYKNKYTHARHTRLICEKLDAVERGEITRLIVTLPPRHSKSRTITESFPAYFMGKKRGRQTMVAGYNTSFAKKFGRENRAKTRLYGPELFGITVSKETGAVTNWKIVDAETGAPTDGGMISNGIGGQFTGEGAHLLIIDDPFKNRKEADSVTVRDMVWNEWKDTFLTRLAPDGRVIVIMTRWHEDDLVGRLLNDPDGEEWEVLNIPCEAEDKNDPLGREIGEPLWPEYGFDKAWMERRKKSVGVRGWNSLYQQRPSVKEGAIFKKHNWRYFQKWPEFLTIEIQTWDCAFKDKDESDYVVGLIMARKGANYYVLDRIRAHMNVRATMAAIKKWHEEYRRADGKYIEDKANGPAIVQMMKDDIPGMIAVPNQDGKLARAYAAEPFHESHNVYLPDPKVFPQADWVPDFVAELAAFPTGKYDDQVDAFTQGMMVLREPEGNEEAAELLRKMQLYNRR